jgi:hypothetical protein
VRATAARNQDEAEAKQVGRGLIEVVDRYDTVYSVAAEGEEDLTIREPIEKRENGSVASNECVGPYHAASVVSESQVSASRRTAV